MKSKSGKKGKKIMSTENALMAELAKTCRSFHEALHVALRKAGVEDKQVYMALGIDRGNFSRMLDGKANFPNEKIQNFCKLVKNDLVLHYLAYKSGYELKVIPKSLEEENLKLREEKEKALERVAYLESLLTRKEKE